MTRRLRMGLIGGGPASFIGPVHRIAAELDREIELVAGAFSQDTARSKEAGSGYGIAPDRAYSSVDAMIAGEAARSDGIDFVTVATPNHHHLEASRAALLAGLGVMSDKPMTATMAQARGLAACVENATGPYAVTYTYSGYPLVREMKARIATGALGRIRKVVASYSQGWLAQDTGGKQAEWRLDPERAGIGGCIADIGVHAFQLVEFVTGLRVTRLLADLGTVVPGRVLDDDDAVLLRFDNGARGVLLASQIETGEMNGLRLRVYGDHGGFGWSQENPNAFTWHRADGGAEIVRAGDPSLQTNLGLRTPGGHPEGYLEAFANLYRDFAAVMRGAAAPLLPRVEDGLRGMTFIDTAVCASARNAGWVDFSTGSGD